MEIPQHALSHSEWIVVTMISDRLSKLVTPLMCPYCNTSIFPQIAALPTNQQQFPLKEYVPGRKGTGKKFSPSLNQLFISQLNNLLHLSFIHSFLPSFLRLYYFLYTFFPKIISVYLHSIFFLISFLSFLL